jgi:hypothetical protein
MAQMNADSEEESEAEGRMFPSPETIQPDLQG